MPRKGRPRLTEDDLKSRVKAYCKAYGAGTTDQGLPEFPSGKRETPQHKEWISLYKLWNRLGKRKRGQCERCQEPAGEGSIFCETHKGESSGPTAEAKLSLEERRGLMTAQKGLCPICALKLDLLESVAHRNAEAQAPALLHASCNRLARLVEGPGREGVDRLSAYLWPRSGKARK